MKFNDFLYSLRKEKGWTQSELAEKLGVTNKAVSKWETGECLPETAMLIPLADVFNLSVDELLRGEKKTVSSPTLSGEQITQTEERLCEKKFNPTCEDKKSASPTTELKWKTNQIVLLSVGIFIIILSVLFPIFLEEIGAMFLLQGVSVGVFLIIIAAFYYSSPLFEDGKKYVRNGYLIAIGVFIIIFSCSFITAPDNFFKNDNASRFTFVVFFVCIATAVILFIVAGITMPKRIFVKSDEMTENSGTKKINKNSLHSMVCGIIMLTATAVFFLVGQIAGRYDISWVAFPVGGILCGISSLIIETIKKD